MPQRSSKEEPTLQHLDDSEKENGRLQMRNIVGQVRHPLVGIKHRHLDFFTMDEPL